MVTSASSTPPLTVAWPSDDGLNFQHCVLPTGQSTRLPITVDQARSTVPSVGRPATCSFVFWRIGPRSGVSVATALVVGARSPEVDNVVRSLIAGVTFIGQVVDGFSAAIPGSLVTVNVWMLLFAYAWGTGDCNTFMY